MATYSSALKVKVSGPDAKKLLALAKKNKSVSNEIIKARKNTIKEILSGNENSKYFKDCLKLLGK